MSIGLECGESNLRNDIWAISHDQTEGHLRSDVWMSLRGECVQA